MADGDQNEQPPRYWFPYWSGPPPPVRPQLSRRLSSPLAPSSPRRPSPSQPRQPTAPATRGAAPLTPPPHASSRPSPSRASPLAPIQEPPPPPNSNSNAAAPARPTPAAKTTKPHGHGHGHGKAAEDKEHNVVDKDKDKDKKHHAGEDNKHKKEKDKKHHNDAGEDGKHKEKEKKHHGDAGEDGKHKEKEKEKEKEKHHHAHSGEDGKHKEKESKAEHGDLHGEIKAGVADMVRKTTGSGHGQGHPAASVITLAGENKGASMKVGGKDGSWKEHQGGHRLDGKQADGQKKKQGMMRALINSNVQVINNSLLLHSSCSGGDPGVHLNLSAKSANKDKQKHAAGADKPAAAKK